MNASQSVKSLDCKLRMAHNDQQGATFSEQGFTCSKELDFELWKNDAGLHIILSGGSCCSCSCVFSFSFFLFQFQIMAELLDRSVCFHSQLTTAVLFVTLLLWTFLPTKWLNKVDCFCYSKKQTKNQAKPNMGFPNMERSQIPNIMDLFSIIFISFRKKKQSLSLLRPGRKVYISLKIG